MSDELTKCDLSGWIGTPDSVIYLAADVDPLVAELREQLQDMIWERDMLLEDKQQDAATIATLREQLVQLKALEQENARLRKRVALLEMNLETSLAGGENMLKQRDVFAASVEEQRARIEQLEQQNAGLKKQMEEQHG